MNRPNDNARPSIHVLLAAALFLAGCVGGTLTAINPLTGERRAFDTESDVPAGWIVCASDDTCPAPRSCDELDEASCLSRTDCSPVYVGIGAYPRECDLPDPPAICSGEAFAGCTASAATCEPADCGPAPEGATYLCSDGSVGGVTGRCVATGDGCGWEIRDCPGPRPEECGIDECGPAPGAPAYVCPDGSIGGNTGRCLRHDDGTCGWELRECPAPSCATIPECDLAACPPGMMFRVDDDGCVHTCECVPAACTDAECGSPPDSPTYTCADGSLGGNIGLCERSAAGVCGWVFRECPAETCAEADCGPRLGAPAILCDDGSIGGNTGRCLRHDDGTCGWELRECPDPCASIPGCDFICPPGTHNPTDVNGCLLTCECVPDAR